MTHVTGHKAIRVESKDVLGSKQLSLFRGRFAAFHALVDPPFKRSVI